MYLIEPNAPVRVPSRRLYVFALVVDLESLRASEYGRNVLYITRRKKGALQNHGAVLNEERRCKDQPEIGRRQRKRSLRILRSSPYYESNGSSKEVDSQSLD